MYVVVMHESDSEVLINHQPLQFEAQQNGNKNS